jgi:hypothetical protein
MTAGQPPLIAEARRRYHRALIEEGVLSVSADGVPSNADKHSTLSVRIARIIADRLSAETGGRLAGQTSGNQFEAINEAFIQETFLSLRHIRPGDWSIVRTGNRDRLAIAEYEQYAHLRVLHEATRTNPELKAVIGGDYTITPDVVIVRGLLKDDEINRTGPIVDAGVSTRTAIREANGGRPLLHASISLKWTIRSDRSQNSRSEALNLIRNRKGHLPHIVVVTAEPLPSRISSIALGTGDIDCVYHFALDELQAAVEEAGAEDAMETLRIMVGGKRLKDISDLPLDLAI